MIVEISKEKLYYFAFVLWFIFAGLLPRTSFSVEEMAFVDFTNRCADMLVLVICSVIIVFFQRYEKEELTKIASASIFILISSILSGNFKILSVWLFVVAGKEIEFDKIVRLVYRMSVFLLPCVMVLSQLGVLKAYTRLRRETILRQSMGFRSPNNMGEVIFLVCICHIYLNYYKMKPMHFVYMLLGGVFCLVVPNSQTATILIFLMIPIYLMGTVFEKNEKEQVLSKILMLGTVISSVISVRLCVFGLPKKEWLVVADRLLSHRFSYSHKVIEMYGV